MHLIADPRPRALTVAAAAAAAAVVVEAERRAEAASGGGAFTRAEHLSWGVREDRGV
jgi:hypothetical protein